MSELYRAEQLLKAWVTDESIRTIDAQLARQAVSYEKNSGTSDEHTLALLMMAAASVSYVLGRGQVCTDINKWVLPRCEFAGQLSAEVLSQCSTVSTVSTGSDSSALFVIHHHRLYLNRYFTYEQQLLSQIQSRVTRSGLAAGDTLSAAIRALFPESHQRFDSGDKMAAEANAGESTGIDWQAVAAATACLQPFCVITGGPGTGKTTTVTKLLSALLNDNPDLRIALAAPTGKAAARMTESIRQARERGSLPHADAIPSESFTLHRLLGWSPSGFRFNRHRCLPYDCVVIDEASMIDLPMMAHLMNALSDKARLILLGDRDQLASVEAGSVLADLCDAGTEHGPEPEFAARIQALTGQDISAYAEATEHSAHSALPMQNVVVQLRKSHRFRSDSGIGALARAVNRGDATAAMSAFADYADIGWLNPESAEWQDKVITGYRRFCELVNNAADPGWILDAFDQFRVLAALRTGPWGIEETNRQIERLLNKAGLLKNTAQLWYPGRAIMIDRNDYDIGLFNGDIGIMVRWQGEDRVVFRGQEGDLRFLSPGRLPSHETAFAMTVHKSQGSEFDEVLLLLPPRWQQVITRELVYTAITRAKKNFWCQAGSACWQQAIISRTERASGLRDALWSTNDIL